MLSRGLGYRAHLEQDETGGQFPNWRDQYKTTSLWSRCSGKSGYIAVCCRALDCITYVTPPCHFHSIPQIWELRDQMPVHGLPWFLVQNSTAQGVSLLHGLQPCVYKVTFGDYIGPKKITENSSFWIEKVLKRLIIVILSVWIGRVD